MANKVKGEIDFRTKAAITGLGDVPAGGHEVTFVLDYNALCSLEDDAPGLMKGQIDVSSPKLIRQIILEGLRRHQPEVTVAEAGDVIQDLGLEAAARMVNESLAVTFGTKPAAPKKGGAVPSTPSPRGARQRTRKSGPGNAG